MINKIFTLILIYIFTIFKTFSQGAFSEANVSNWDQPIDLEFDQQGRMFVAERIGRVYQYKNNAKILVLDIVAEVATYGDFGLLNIALDPQFSTNGYIYLYYVVDRHHLMNFGLPTYNSGISEQGATIARVSRFTLNAANNFESLVPNSKLILLGETKSTGFPLTGPTHAGGGMAFGLDGSLLIVCGDGSQSTNYESQALADGIITQAEYNANRYWRCQMQNSLAGKLVRIDPANGNGLDSNPFYNVLNPRSAESRLWAKGLRSPFRLCLKPNTGSHEISAGNPGVFLIGDVGQDTKEEINIVSAPNQNFGWPRLEGIDLIFANNPIYNPTITKAPTIEYGRVGNPRVIINNAVTEVSSSGFSYPSFVGSSAIGGVFYQGDVYPPSFKNNYFFADFNNDWTKTVKFDNNNNPISIENFPSYAGGIVAFSYNSFSETLYYVSIQGKIGEIKYSINGNQPPVANFNFTPLYGESPASISFDASSTTDLDNANLSYNWAFGDNTNGTGKTITHLFNAIGGGPQMFTVTLTVSDGSATNSISKIASINNTPPKILSTSLDSIDKFSTEVSAVLNLSATVADTEEPIENLSYKWEGFLFHNEHSHPEYTSTQATGAYMIGSIACDNNSYFYRVKLTVTDSYGLSSVYIKDIQQNCNTTDLIPPSKANIFVENFKANGYTLRWTSPTDDISVKTLYIIINDKTTRLSTTATSFEYSFPYDIRSQTFEAQLIVTDIGGNTTKSSKIFFKRPEELCYEKIYLSDITPVSATNGNGPIELDKNTNSSAPNDGNPLRINGEVFAKGIGVHANSTIIYNLSNIYNNTFFTKIGMDDAIGESTCGSVQFKIYKDNVLAYTSPIMYAVSAVRTVSLDVANTTLLKLEVNNAGDSNGCDHANWVDTQFLPTCAILDLTAPQTANSMLAQMENGLVNISWNPATDNQDSAPNYEIYLDGELASVQAGTMYSFSDFPSGLHEITVQVKDNRGNISSNNVFVYRCNSSIINASAAADYNCDFACDDMHTIKSGQWDDPLVWYCNKVPSLGNMVKINAGHQISLPANYSANIKNIENSGEIIFNTNSTISLSDQ